MSTRASTLDPAWDQLQEGGFEPHDPCESPNRDQLAACCTQLMDFLAREEIPINVATLMWRFVGDTGDYALPNTQYPILRPDPVGPKVPTRQQ